MENPLFVDDSRTGNPWISIAATRARSSGPCFWIKPPKLRPVQGWYEAEIPIWIQMLLEGNPQSFWKYFLRGTWIHRQHTHIYLYIYTVHHICMRLYWCIVPFYAVHCLSRRCKKAFNTENVKHVLELRGRHTWEWYGLIICIYTCTHLTGSLFQNWNCSPHASSMNYDLLFEKNINRPTEDHIIHIVYVIYIYICNYM